MGRYLRILLALVLLAAIYFRLGGFASAPLARSQEHNPPLQGSALSGLDGQALAADAPLPAWGEAGDFETPAAPTAAGLEVEIQKNESFYLALQRHGLAHETIMQIVKACKPHTNLRSVQRGDRFPMTLNPSGEFASLRVPVDLEHYVDVVNGDGVMTASLQSLPVERVVRAVRGSIETNLFDAIALAGGDAALTDEVASILGWEIDFLRDLRVGDQFTVLFEEYEYEGKPIRPGQVLACQFTNQGREYHAYLFENEFELPSYYDAEGKSLERQFLRAPLKYSRISSGFSKRRLHPVTRTVRPHWGVDYVAPVGTPVHATADGIVIQRERERAEGNVVGVRHGQSYETYYLHLSRFAQARIGDRVRQGDVIGYVGNTGMSTAPHLDYRIKHRGNWINPSKLKLPASEPVPAERRDAFFAARDLYLQELARALGVDVAIEPAVRAPEGPMAD